MPRKFLALPELKTLKDLFILDENTPSALKWRSTKNSAGKLKSNGYWYVRIEKKEYLCHRIAYYLKTGENPGNNFVDHVNRDPSNNVNLRLASNAQNVVNTSKRNPEKCTSKYKGVYWNKALNKWGAQIYVGGKNIYLGFYDLEIEAASAFNEAATKFWGEFAYVNKIEN